MPEGRGQRQTLQVASQGRDSSSSSPCLPALLISIISRCSLTALPVTALQVMPLIVDA
jgi:hypothetical protein